jgi:glycolate oxidase
MAPAYGKVTPDIVARLKEIAGEKNVIVDDQEKLKEYGRDIMALAMGMVYLPEAVVKPGSTEEVAGIMKLANEHRIPVTPRAAGSGLAGAAIPLEGGILMSMERMNRILEIDPIDRVAVVEPGLITNELCQKVIEQGLMYAGYPMSTQTSFIGGNVATNAGGGKVIRYGNTRRHILGLTVVLPSGEVIELGGRYRKSTWGYDLLQLMIGSEGTLGIVTKVIVNLTPAPGRTVDLFVPFPDPQTAVAAVGKLIVDGKILPEAVEYMDRLCLVQSATYHEITIPFMDNEEAEAFLIIQLAADTQEALEELYEKAGELCLDNGALDVFVAESRTDSENIWKVREEYSPGLNLITPYIRHGGDIVVPFSQVPEMMRELARLEEKHQTHIATTGHIADGNLHTAIFKPENVAVEDWPPLARALYDEITEIALRLGGVGSGEHGVGILKKPLFLATKSPAELEIMRGIKRAFDPNLILNPGKIL